MDRTKKITQITEADVADIIKNSVQNANTRLVGNAAETKKMFVKPIANTDGSPNVLNLVKRVAEEAENALNEVSEHFSNIVVEQEGIKQIATEIADEKTRGLQPSIDKALETASKTIVGAINELRSALAKATVLELSEVVSELPEAGQLNKFYLVSKEDTNENDLYDEYIWINKGTKDEPAYGWEFTGTKKIEVNLDDYVKNTDIATNEKYGVLKLGKGLLLTEHGEGEVVDVIEADTEAINNRNPTGMITVGNGRQFISTEKLDEAVKASMTGYKQPILPGGGYGSASYGNQPLLTDEEKQSARTWVGAVGETDYGNLSKCGVVKWADSQGIYITDDGILQLVTSSEPHYENRGKGGVRQTYSAVTIEWNDYATMVALADCKEPELWTDDSTDESGNVVKGTKTKACELLGTLKAVTNKAGSVRAYVVQTDGTQGTYNIATSPLGTNGYVIALYLPEVLGDTEAQAWLISKTPTKPYHTTTKDYVDNLPDKLTLTDEEKAKWKTWIDVTDGQSICYYKYPYLYGMGSNPDPTGDITMLTDGLPTGIKDGDLCISADGILFKAVYVDSNLIPYYIGKYLADLKAIPSITDHSTETTPYLDISFGKTNEMRKAFFEHSLLLGTHHYGDGFIQDKNGNRMLMPMLSQNETMATENGVQAVKDEVNTSWGYYGKTGADKHEIKCGGIYIVFAGDYDLKLCKADGTAVISGAQQLFIMTAPYNGDKGTNTVFVAMGMYIYESTFSITNLKIPVEAIQVELNDGSYITTGSTSTQFYVSEMVKGK